MSYFLLRWVGKDQWLGEELITYADADPSNDNDDPYCLGSLEEANVIREKMIKWYESAGLTMPDIEIVPFEES